MLITGTHFNYFQICKRKLWLFANGIQMEHTSDLVYEGRLIHEDSYAERSDRYEEVELEGIKVDYFDAKRRIIHEIKKTNKQEQAHEWQLKYYLYVFERNGITGVSGILEYPTMRKTCRVDLSDVDREMIQEMEEKIREVILKEECPDSTRRPLCKNCSYYDFCFCGEEDGV